MGYSIYVVLVPFVFRLIEPSQNTVFQSYLGEVFSFPLLSRGCITMGLICYSLHSSWISPTCGVIWIWTAACFSMGPSKEVLSQSPRKSQAQGRAAPSVSLSPPSLLPSFHPLPTLSQSTPNLPFLVYSSSHLSFLISSTEPGSW